MKQQLAVIQLFLKIELLLSEKLTPPGFKVLKRIYSINPIPIVCRMRALNFIISGFYFTLASCTLPIESNDARTSYKYWAGEEPPKNLKIINGQYKQSLHFTLEYTLFLEIAPNPGWWDSLKQLNKYIPDTTKWNPPANAPAWFKPAVYCKKWKSIDDFNNSRLIEDSLKKHYFVYIEQL